MTRHINSVPSAAQAGYMRDAGAVLPLCIFFAFILLLFGGLAIDSIVIGSSRAQHQHTTEYVALAALRAYGNPASGQELTQLTAARERAEEIAGVNIFLSKGFQQNNSYAEEFGTAGPGATGRIQPGIWHATPEFSGGVCQGATPCPCDSDGNWSGPCFEGLDFSVSADLDRPVNAFHAELWLKDGSPIRTLFAKLVGQNSWTFSSKATATVKPTHGVFLVDLSKSSHSETHLPWERAGAGISGAAAATEYALRITNKSCPADESLPCNTVAPSSAYSCSFPASVRTPTDCDFFGGWQAGETGDGMAGAIFNYDCPDIMPRVRTSFTTPRRHAKLDYRCYEVGSYVEDGVTKSGGSYLVDAYRGTLTSGVTYDGPEPLTSMLDAVHYASSQMLDRQVPGDLLGVIGVDQSATIDVRTLPLSAPGTTTFTDIQEITDPAIDSSTVTRLSKRNREHFFFPRDRNGFNLVAGLEAAVQQLDSAVGSKDAEAFIAVITDGLLSCSTNSIESCSEIDEPHIRSLVDATVEYVQAELVPRSIKFHLLLNGDIVGPSTLVRKGNSSSTANRCMTESEVRQSDLSFVDFEPAHGGQGPKEALFKRPGSSFYPYPLKLYEAVASSGGVYGPLRPPCLATLAPTGTTCESGGVEQLLDTKCSASVGALGSVIGAQPSLVDSYGRLTCDPRCRDVRTQARGYVDRVLERNPYLLVQ